MIEPSLSRPEAPGVLYDVAGVAGSHGRSGNGGPAIKARLYRPVDAYIHPVSRDVYITDWNNHIYRRIDEGGIITDAYGSVFGDDLQGPADIFRMSYPTDMSVGPEGDTYLVVWGNSKIVFVDRVNNYAVTTVKTIPPDDHGPQPDRTVVLPVSVAFDSYGAMYFSDQGNGRIRKVDSLGMTTFAGRFVKGYRDGVGQIAMFSWSRGPNALPGGKIAITSDGRSMYVADQENNRIRKIDMSTAEVTTVAGTGETGYSGDGGEAMSATLNYPCDVTCAPSGDVYFADTRNHVVRRINTEGVITTIAGTGVPGFSPNATLATDAMLNHPIGVFFDGSNNTLYIADTYNSQIKRTVIPD